MAVQRSHFDVGTLCPIHYVPISLWRTFRREFVVVFRSWKTNKRNEPRLNGERIPLPSVVAHEKARQEKKRLQRRKEYDKCKFKANAVIEGLTDRLRIETKQRERLLFLARKYYLKWKENKDLLLRRNGGNLPSASRFGTRAKVSK